MYCTSLSTYLIIQNPSSYNLLSLYLVFRRLEPYYLPTLPMALHFGHLLLKYPVSSAFLQLTLLPNILFLYSVFALYVVWGALVPTYPIPRTPHVCPLTTVSTLSGVSIAFWLTLPAHTLFVRSLLFTLCLVTFYQLISYYCAVLLPCARRPM